MSAYSQLQGLYPLGTASLYEVGEKFGASPFSDEQVGIPGHLQTIPVHTESTDTDAMLLPGRNCERHEQLMRQKRESKKYLDRLASERTFFNLVAEIAGIDDVDSFSIWDMTRISDAWKYYQAYSVPLQPQVTKES